MKQHKSEGNDNGSCSHTALLGSEQAERCDGAAAAGSETFILIGGGSLNPCRAQRALPVSPALLLPFCALNLPPQPQIE